MAYLPDPGSTEELHQAFRDLESQVDSKCSQTVFWSTITMVVGVLIVLFGFLFTRQNTLAESVAGINATMASAQKVRDDQATTLGKISDTQVDIAKALAVTAAAVNRTSQDVRDLVGALKEAEIMTADIVARIAREQIAWAKERERKDKS